MGDLTVLPHRRADAWIAAKPVVQSVRKVEKTLLFCLDMRGKLFCRGG